MAKRTTADEFRQWEQQRAELYERFVARWRHAYERDQHRRRLLRRLTLGVLGRHETVSPPPSS